MFLLLEVTLSKKLLDGLLAGMECGKNFGSMMRENLVILFPNLHFDLLRS